MAAGVRGLEETSTASYVYLYADGLYLNGDEQDETALLVVLGVDEQGHKSCWQWSRAIARPGRPGSEVLRSLKERGLVEPTLLAMGDAALGLWAALDEVFPSTRHQRCWNHYADLRIMPTWLSFLTELALKRSA